MEDYKAHTTEIVALRKAGDYEGVKNLMIAAAEEREKAEAEEQAKEEAEVSSEGV